MACHSENNGFISLNFVFNSEMVPPNDPDGPKVIRVVGMVEMVPLHIPEQSVEPSYAKPRPLLNPAPSVEVLVQTWV